MKTEKEVIIINISLAELRSIIQETVSVEFEKLRDKNISEKYVDDFVTMKETADLLNISLPTLRKYVRQGKIPAYRIGYRILFKRYEILSSMSEVQKRNLLNQ